MSISLLSRVALAIALATVGVLVAPFGAGQPANVAAALLLAGLVVGLEVLVNRAPPANLLGACLGGALGLGVASLIGRSMVWSDASGAGLRFFNTFVLIVLPYLGAVTGARHGEWLRPSKLVSLFRTSAPARGYKIFDTSVIIDGRIADVCETGFVDGTVVIPQFVLKELQAVADSSDSLKRNRGRRGLDILQKIQKMAGMDVVVSDVDFPDVREVDLKLIELARMLPGKIVTNDFNLNKVAQLRGVDVLNINELANALKPVVLPGEFMQVFVLKEGKEYNQGVAYLDDGTMVVVDNARKYIGKTIDIVVTSVLQTTAGKMIFGRHLEPSTTVAQTSGTPPAGASPGATSPATIPAATQGPVSASATGAGHGAATAAGGPPSGPASPRAAAGLERHERPERPESARVRPAGA